MSKAVTQSPSRGRRCGVTGVLCALILGIIGLYGVETHCSEPAENGSHSATQLASQAEVGLHTVSVQSAIWIEQANSPFSGGDLLVCALVASLVALLLAAIRTRHPSGSWLVPAVRDLLGQPLRRPLLTTLPRTHSPLRC